VTHDKGRIWKEDVVVLSRSALISFIKHGAMKMNGGVEVEVNHSALSAQLHDPAALFPGERFPVPVG
jgi:hypothetical protein